MNTVHDSLEQFQAVLGCRFGDLTLLQEAMTHSSYRNEHADVDYDNERLEFLGDSVVGLVVSHALSEKFPQASEGRLTRFRSKLVSERGLCDCADSISLGKFLFLGKGEESSGGRRKPSLLAGGFEALIAAVYLDAGFEAVSQLVRKIMAPGFESLRNESVRGDFKTRVQEEIQARFHTVPRYLVVRESGPDHDKEFEVTMQLEGKFLSSGKGHSKKEAEQEAARLFAEKLADNPDVLNDVLGGKKNQGPA